MKITFVILHYITVKDTIECINSIIKNIDYENIDVVVVDNASPNNSYKELKNIFFENNKIHFIKNNENLGFAKGNNVGFKYAKHELCSDFIIMINNDTIIEQKEFCELIICNYNESGFAVLGPNIKTPINSIHQNPIPKMFYSKNDVKKRILKYKILHCLSFLHLDNFTSSLFSKLSSNFRKRNYEKNGDFQLHGCCLIFSPIYISMFEGLFDKTFMYMEEPILKYLCEANNLKMEYDPKIKIFHKEYGSTNVALSKTIKKRRFYYYNSIKSAKEFVKLMESEC